MNRIVIFGPAHSGKTTLLGYLSTAMLRHPQFNEEVYNKLKLIKTLSPIDEFNIGDPANPHSINKDVILPSFVSLDKDELRKFRAQDAEGTSKRLHRRQLTICTSETSDPKLEQNENENISCTFVDTPGFRQRLSDKYRSFFEGNIGIAVLELGDVIKLWNAKQSGENLEEDLEKRLFESIRIWCDYRSSSSLLIVLSKVDCTASNISEKEDAIQAQIDAIKVGISCVHYYLMRFCKKEQIPDIPIVPISINVDSAPNTKKYHRMDVFFYRRDTNIYVSPPWKDKPNLGSGTFISSLKKVLLQHEPLDRNSVFSMAGVDRKMKALVDYKTKDVLSVLPFHGNLHIEDKVKLGPVIVESTNEVIYTECTISSIKADGAKQPSTVLLERNTGGIIFKEIHEIGLLNRQYCFDKNTGKKPEIKLSKSTILFSGEVLYGDIITLKIYKKDYILVDGGTDKIYREVLSSIMPYDNIFIFWYGKKLMVQIVEIIKDDDTFQLSVLLPKNVRNLGQHLVLPCDVKGQVKYHDNVLLAIPESLYSNKPMPTLVRGEKRKIPEIYTYINANIETLKTSTNYNAVKIEAAPQLALRNILQIMFILVEIFLEPG